MPGGPAVSVHHDLPARQSGVPLGASYHEAPCGVDQVSGVFVHQAFRDHLADDFPDDVLLDGVMPDLREMLRGHYHSIHPYRPAVLIFHRHLRLPVRPQVRDIPVLPCLGKLPCKGMGQIDRHGHQLVRFVRGIPEYHPLVAGPKLLLLAPPDLQRPADTLGNVRGLAVDGGNDCDRVRIEPETVVPVPNLTDRIAGNCLNVNPLQSPG